MGIIGDGDGHAYPINESNAWRRKCDVKTRLANFTNREWPFTDCVRIWRSGISCTSRDRR